MLLGETGSGGGGVYPDLCGSYQLLIYEKVVYL
jgi:hypothetical protein